MPGLKNRGVLDAGHLTITFPEYTPVMRRFFFAFAFALLGVAHANSYAPPRPLFVAGKWSDYGFKFVPQKVTVSTASAQSATGELVQLQTDGTLKTLWKRPLVNVPSRILISPRGHIVTLDNWAGYGSPKHALVIYDLKGKVTADLTYEQVMRGSPPCPKCQSMDGAFLSWGYAPSEGGKIDFTTYGQQDEWFILLRDAQGQGPTISLRTGEFKTNWNGRPRR